jgi:hypothetical protein
LFIFIVYFYCLVETILKTFLKTNIKMHITNTNTNTNTNTFTIDSALVCMLNFIYKLFIIIIRWTNPVYIVLTPFAYIARLCHQVPIILNARKRSMQTMTYNKYAMVTLPCDANFIQDRWHSIQYIEWRFSDLWTRDKCKDRCDIWSMRNFNCKSNFIENEGSVKEYVEAITRKKPSQVIINATHLAVYFKNTIVIIMDHYFCDGMIIDDLIRQLFREDNITSKAFPKYISYPLISDYIAIEYFGRRFIENIRYPSLIGGLAYKTCVMTEIVKKNTIIPWNRWTIYAHGIYNVYEALPQDVNYLHVALTVGFDSDKTFGNNRIGAIIVTIKREHAYLSYNEKILNYMEQFKTQTIANMNDAHTSYDILRSYNMSYIRSSKMQKVIDIYFTSLFYKQELSHSVSGLGGFIGALKSAENTNISSIARGSQTFFT